MSSGLLHARRLSRRAAIDVGTNTVRLLIVDGAGAELVREHEITRLGAGVDADRHLGAEPIERTVAAIGAFVDRAVAAGADEVRIAATSAVRDASNRDAFLEAVEQRTGHRPQVLDGSTEGRIAYAGATSGLPDGRYVVCDIGGGSTELTTGHAQVSMDIGSVRLRERFGPHTGSGIDEARAFVRPVLTGGVDQVSPAGCRPVGVAGTFSTLAALVLGLDVFDAGRVHRSVVARSEMEGWPDRFRSMTVEEIAALGPVETGRADVIAYGTLIAVEVAGAVGADDVLVSVHDILDGLARAAV